MKPVRVRFAPSPTGHLHIGGLRTALFNWLFARHYNGAFLLRIEDTDTVRSQDIFTKSILDSLSWANLEGDEPLVTQSQRMDLYKEKINYLLQQGKAYRCFCAGNAAQQPDEYFKYDGKCRAGVHYEDGRPFVVRIKLPLDQPLIEFNDLIRGPISFNSDQFDDFIIARTDGTPIYNFVVVVDDAAMNVSHIIRGEDHISNTPKQIVLYQAFGYEVPAFAHLPLILGPTGARLSKRDAATAVSDYKHNGYLADALCNYLVRLGWAHGDQEIFTREELISLFTLTEVNKKGAIFDQQKLDWMNGIYLRQTDAQTLLNTIIGDVEPSLKSLLSSWDTTTIERAIALYQERVKTLKELVAELVILHNGNTAISSEDFAQWITPKTAEQLTLFMQKIQDLSEFNHDVLALVAKEVAREYDIKLVALAQPLRLALIGKTHGPGVFDMLSFLGKKESTKRITHFLDYIQSAQ